jgi:2-amino-4-hydroxy-6-hydroxymethyldihydropteridine diphosphokinase
MGGRASCSRRSPAGGDAAALALISIGSNIAPARHLPLAVARLAQHCRVLAVSAAFETPAVGPPGQPTFLNAAARVTTDLSPTAFKEQVLRPIEEALGRERSGDRYAPRTIDLDLVCYCGGEPGEQLPPDPELWRQLHLALPMAEIASDLRHPRTEEPLETACHRLLAAAATPAAYRRRPEIVLARAPAEGSESGS